MINYEDFMDKILEDSIPYKRRIKHGYYYEPQFLFNILPDYRRTIQIYLSYLDSVIERNIYDTILLKRKKISRIQRRKAT